MNSFAHIRKLYMENELEAATRNGFLMTFVFLSVYLWLHFAPHWTDTFQLVECFSESHSVLRTERREKREKWERECWFATWNGLTLIKCSHLHYSVHLNMRWISSSEEFSCKCPTHIRKIYHFIPAFRTSFSCIYFRNTSYQLVWNGSIQFSSL